VRTTKPGTLVPVALHLAAAEVSASLTVEDVARTWESGLAHTSAPFLIAGRGPLGPTAILSPYPAPPLQSVGKPALQRSLSNTLAEAGPPSSRSASHYCRLIDNNTILWYTVVHFGYPDRGDMHTTKVSSKGCGGIPKALREKHGFDQGTRVRVVEYGEVLVLVPLPDDPVDALDGMLEDGPCLTADLLMARARQRTREESSRE